MIGRTTRVSINPGEAVTVGFSNQGEIECESLARANELYADPGPELL